MHAAEEGLTGVWDSGFRDQGSGFMVEDLGSRV
jgi:hypothetical protein